MERLTERDEYGNADIIALSDVMPEIYSGLSFAETNALTDALNRLADYEDAGLEPEDITGVVDEEVILKWAGRCLSTTPGHLRELVQAEKEGRLVMLPCKVGADIYRLGKKEVCDYWQIAKVEIYEDEIILEDDSENVIFPEDIGKTVFLTREEAEAALEAQKGGEGK